MSSSEDRVNSTRSFRRTVCDNIEALAFGPSHDAFGNLRVSSPVAQFESRLTGDAQALLWDDQETSGGGTGSSHDADASSQTLSVSASTAGTRKRQTFQRMDYQAGRSTVGLFTFTFGAKATGITRRVGLFDDNDGVFFEQDENGVRFVVRSSTSGSPVDTKIEQADWNNDRLDGQGPDQVTFDEEQSHILCIDYQWLGVGTVRFQFVIDGKIYLCHSQHHSNKSSGVYMKNPSLPIRYELSNDGTGGAATLEAICCSASVEAGTSEYGIVRSISNDDTQLDAAVVGTLYAALGVRMKTAQLGRSVSLLHFTFMGSTQNDLFHWKLVLDPTVAGTFTYSDLTNSAVQTATGATANTITGGTVIDSGYVSAQQSTAFPSVENLVLGAAIDGTQQELVLCIMPISGVNLDVFSSMTWREH